MSRPKTVFGPLREMKPVIEEQANRELAGEFAAARAGDRGALERLTEACRPFLLKIANDELDSGLRVKTAASDLVQTALFKAQQAFAKFLGDSDEELRAWLRHILRNSLIDEARRYRETAARDLGKELSLDAEQGVSLRRELQAGLKTPLDDLVGLEKKAALELCLARLPEEYRRAIQMRHVDEKSFAEIGAALGKSAEAARKIWFRALARLRQELKAHEEFGSTTG